ncbi:MAG: hypothetical protein ACTSRG_11545 [Candidatus Helarchaeota archaeon]
MIKGLIITSSSGINLFYKSYGCEFDSELLSNFLVANNVFSSKMIGESIDKIQMKEQTQFVFDRDEESHLIFILIADIEDHLFYLKLKLEHIKRAFLKNFPDVCKEHTLMQTKYHKIPNKQLVESIIDPIIFPIYHTGNISELINHFGVKKVAIIFSSLLSKQKIIVLGDDVALIKRTILTFPILVPFREFFITTNIYNAGNIAIIVPLMKSFDLNSAPDCWWIIGLERANYKSIINKSITVIDTETKKIINSIDSSFYEYNLIKLVKNIKNDKIANMTISNKLEDLLNVIRKLTIYNTLDENILKLHGIAIYFLPVIKKIMKHDFAIELNIQEHYFTTKVKQIFG